MYRFDWKYKVTVLLFVSGLFVCTINDDAGNPATTEPPAQMAVDDPALLPSLLTDLDSVHVFPGDTLAIRIKVLQDTSTNASAFSNALITANTSEGWINYDSLITDSDGRATLLFSDTVDGDKEIKLKCYSLEQTIRINVTKTPDQTQKYIEALPEYSTIKADGKSYTLINVKVINKYHNPIAGEYVRFITTAGTVAGTQPPEGNSGQSLTNIDGIATAKLISANINDTAYITVYLVSNRTFCDETQVAFHGVKINTIIDSTNIRIGSTTKITAEVLNGSDEPIANVPIFNRLGLGKSSNIIVTEYDSLTGFDGKAQFSVHGVSSGTDTFTISSSGAHASTRINVTNLILTLDLDANVLQASSELSTNLHVLFTDLNSTPLQNKKLTIIRYYLNKDNIPESDTLTGTTNSSGMADFSIQAPDHETDMKIEVLANNSSTDVASAETTIKFIKTRKIIIQAFPSLIAADGTSKSIINVYVKNELNNPIVGDAILFSTDAGIITRSSVTDSSGKASAYLTSDRRNTLATVKAYLEKDITQKDSITVEFSGVTITTSISPQSISSNGSDTSIVSIKLTDASMNTITGENVIFYKQNPLTNLKPVDLITDNRGTAKCKITGSATGHDTITIEAAGAKAKAVIYYSSNNLSIDTLAGTYTGTIANGKDSTELHVTYKDGAGVPIANATVEVSVTIGNLGGVFAKTLSTDASGKTSFKMLNPQFANTATISALAMINNDITSTSFKLYFRADIIKYVQLKGSPKVISTNGDRAIITATAYDSMDNLVKDAHISFNIVDGPGGGEYIDPPIVITGANGTAETNLISGTIPSEFQGVRIVAGDFSTIKTDTLTFTIAGPPHNITIRTNVGQLQKYESTYGKKVSVIVTDVNGNPVADGTEVTFSAQIVGYRIFSLRANLELVPVKIDTVHTATLYFEDFNDDFVLDAEIEDINKDGILNRGENVNGDRNDKGNDNFLPGPGFHDINWNGRREYKFNMNDYITHRWNGGLKNTYPYRPAEPFLDEIRITPITDTIGGTIFVRRYDTTFVILRFADFNGNNHLDVVEPLMDPNMTDSAYESQPGFDKNLGHYTDIDWNQNGVPDPSTAISITRTEQTINGVADNELIYGQSDALRIVVRLSAESKGLETKSPEIITLPILEKDYKYWSYKPSGRSK